MAGLPSKIKLEIVSPNRLLLSEDVDEVTLPGSEGYLGILPGHLPLLTMLGVGVISYHQGQHKRTIAVSGGFVEVLSDRVIVMGDTLELPEEIDAERARQAKERAEKRLYSRDAIDIDRAMGSLLRAATRLHIAETRR